MPTYDTPQPIAVEIDLGAADVRIVASERADTALEVRPSDASDESDVAAAREVTVDLVAGALQVAGPKSRLFTRKTRSVDVVVELPAGSAAAVHLQVGGVRAEGRLGACDITVAAGGVHVERVGTLRAKTSAGNVTAETVDGDATISTGSGRVRAGRIAGAATIENANGHVVVDEVRGTAALKSANGDLHLGRGGSDVVARTSNGSVRLDEVVRGSVELATAMGDLEVGVAAGTAAWLDVSTGFGHVHRELDGATRPESSDETVEVRGRTRYGDIVVRRAGATRAPAKELS